MTGKQGGSASVHILPYIGSDDSRDIGEVREAGIALPMTRWQGDTMATIYVLLLLTLLVFVLYVTWRPSNKKSAQSASKRQPIVNAAREVTGISKVTDLPNLDFPTSRAQSNAGATRRH